MTDEVEVVPEEEKLGKATLEDLVNVIITLLDEGEDPHELLDFIAHLIQEEKIHEADGVAVAEALKEAIEDEKEEEKLTIEQLAKIIGNLLDENYEPKFLLQYISSLIKERKVDKKVGSTVAKALKTAAKEDKKEKRATMKEEIKNRGEELQKKQYLLNAVFDLLINKEEDPNDILNWVASLIEKGEINKRDGMDIYNALQSAVEEQKQEEEAQLFRTKYKG